jgi:pyruvate/2-oxoacid:ferredoxin oxidoreductase beta subunit
MVAAVLQLLASTGKSAAEEGRDIILMMLAVGLTFIAVILIGDLGKWARKRRKAS